MVHDTIEFANKCQTGHCHANFNWTLPCKLYLLTTRTITSYWCFLAFWCLRSRCSRFFNVLNISMTFLHTHSYGLFLKMGWVVSLRKVKKIKFTDFTYTNINYRHCVSCYIIIDSGNTSTTLWWIDSLKSLVSSNIIHQNTPANGFVEALTK